MATEETMKTARWRSRNKEKYLVYRREYEKKYSKTEKRKKYLSDYSKKWHSINREKRRPFAYEIRLRWYQDHPDGIKAHYLVREAIRKGKMTKPDNCIKCKTNNKRLEAHHDNYSKPYEVKWLCRSCHILQHKQ